MPAPAAYFANDRKRATVMAARWQEWQAYNEHIHDINKVVAGFEIDLDGQPGGRLKIKILETTDGRYMGVTNFCVQSLEMATPYSSSHPQDSVDEAFWDALNGLLVWGPETLWILNESY